MIKNLIFSIFFLLINISTIFALKEEIDLIWEDLPTEITVENWTIEKDGKFFTVYEKNHFF
jgi:hypothetical protein